MITAVAYSSIIPDQCLLESAGHHHIDYIDSNVNAVNPYRWG